MAQRQRRDGVAVEVALQEAVGGHAEFDLAGGGVLDDGGTVLLDEGEDAEDAADADGALLARSAIPFIRVEPPLLGRLGLMIGRAMLGSLRSASKEAADAGTPEDRDLHPMCTLREQTPRKKNPDCARKYMKTKEKIWSRRADSNR